MNQWLVSNPDAFFKIMEGDYKARSKMYETLYPSEPSWSSPDEEYMFERTSDGYIARDQFNWVAIYLTACDYYYPGCAEETINSFNANNNCPCSNKNGIIPFIHEIVMNNRCDSSLKSKLGDPRVRKTFAWYAKIYEELR